MPASLVEELGAGEVVGGMVDVYADEERAGQIPFDAGKDQ